MLVIIQADAEKKGQQPPPHMGTIVRLLSTWTQWCGFQLQHGTRERTLKGKQAAREAAVLCKTSPGAMLVSMSASMLNSHPHQRDGSADCDHCATDLEVTIKN